MPDYDHNTSFNPRAEEEGFKPAPAPAALDLDSDEPLVCNRDQSGDTTCEACQ